jgi:hypothetical protein
MLMAMMDIEEDAEGDTEEPICALSTIFTTYDSRASCHMTPHRDQFVEYTEIEPRPINSASGKPFYATGIGKVNVHVPCGTETKTITLKHVLHAPGMRQTLVSIGRLTDVGYRAIYEGPTCELFSPKDSEGNRELLAIIPKKNGIYIVPHVVRMPESAMSAKHMLTLYQLHERLGHVSFSKAKMAMEAGK